MRISKIVKVGSALLVALLGFAALPATGQDQTVPTAEVTPTPLPDTVPSATPSPTPTPSPTSTPSVSETAEAYPISAVPSPSPRMPFRITASVQSGYDDNILTTSVDQVGTWFTNTNVKLAYDLSNPRTQLEVDGGGGIAYYFDRPGNRDYDPNGFFDLLFSHKITPRLIVGTSAYVTYQVEPDFALNTGLDRRSGNYFYTSDKFSLGYNWTPRFSTVASYTFSRTAYDEQSVAFFEDRFEHTFGNEFRFLAWPTTTVVAEYRFQIVDYDSVPRDSTTHYLLAGFDHNFSPRFDVSLRTGVQFRSYDTFGDKTDPYFEGALTYKIDPKSSIIWNIHYGIEEPDVFLASSRTAFRTGLQVRYDLTARILTSLAFYYEHDDNAGVTTNGVVSPGFEEDSYALALSAQYAINHNWAVGANYEFTDVVSGAPFRSYTRNRIYWNLNFTF